MTKLSPQPETVDLNKSEFKFFRDPEIRRFLREATDNVIRQVQAGNFDTVIFLDRAARYYGHLFKHQWQLVFPEQACPHILFVNIGREKQTTTEHIGTVVKDADAIRMACEVERQIGTRYNMSGKRIVVLDDDVASGVTINSACDILKLAFTQASYVGLGSFTASKDQFKYFDVKPIIRSGGNDLWYKFPKLPCGPEDMPLLLMPEQKYLRGRLEQVLTRIEQLEKIDRSESQDQRIIKKAALVLDWNADDREFYNDYLWRKNVFKTSTEKIDQCMNNMELVLYGSCEYLKQAFSSPRALKRNGYGAYLENLKTNLVAEVFLIEDLLKGSAERVAEWGAALGEVRKIIEEKD